MPIQNVDNPAARFLNLFEKLDSCQHNLPSFQAWAAVLVVNANDTIELLEKIGRAMRLPKVTKDALSAVPDTPQIYFEWIPAIESAFKANRLSDPLQEFLAPISPDARRTLRFCADRLALQAPEEILKLDDLTKLRREAAELQTELQGADIDLDLKEFALDHLKVIIGALNEYDIFGIRPVRRAAQEAIGAATVNRRTARRLYAIPVGKKLFNYVVETLRLLGSLHGALQIPGDFHHQLQLESPRPPLKRRQTRPNHIPTRQARPAAMPRLKSLDETRRTGQPDLPCTKRWHS